MQMNSSKVVHGKLFLVMATLCALLVQYSLEANTVGLRESIESAGLCKGNTSLFGNAHCLIPWWANALTTAMLGIVVLISLLRYRQLGARWCYLVLPCGVMLTSAVVPPSNPVVYVERVAAQ